MRTRDEVIGNARTRLRLKYGEGTKGEEKIGEFYDNFTNEEWVLKNVFTFSMGNSIYRKMLEEIWDFKLPDGVRETDAFLRGRFVETYEKIKEKERIEKREAEEREKKANEEKLAEIVGKIREDVPVTGDELLFVADEWNVSCHGPLRTALRQCTEVEIGKVTFLEGYRRRRLSDKTVAKVVRVYRSVLKIVLKGEVSDDTSGTVTEN